MKLVLRFSLMLLLGTATPVLADPIVTSWFTLHSGQTARIYRTDDEKSAGLTESVWSNGRQQQLTPANTGVQQIMISSNWVYVRSTGLGSQIMGPWYNDPQHYRPFPNLPTDQHIIFCLPRHPVPARSYTRQSLGDIGITVDGVAIFDANDAFSYSHANRSDATPRARIGQGDRIWERDAYVNEGITFDASLGHQENRGRYHYHADAIALRYELGDHVDFDATAKTYHESAGPVVKHSPILGWMKDGYPLYGPYGYSNPTNAASPIRRLVSGFVLRDGRDGADDLAQTGRRTLPAWDARELYRSAQLEDDETGPAVSPQYPLGHYLQDYAYLGDLGKKLGKDYDLDELNGRWCVTPEFPNGTYAYFTTINEAGKPAFPYTMGRSYRGQPYGRQIGYLRETVQTIFTATPAKSATTALNSAAPTTTLIWSPKNDGQYQAK